MINAWKIIWQDNDHRYIKRFEGESPADSGAVEYGKKLQKRGLTVNIVSQRKAFAPPKNKILPPKFGMIWCPYCLKWRDFHEVSIMGKDGVRSPVQWRCPVCTISIRDHYVRLYNLDMVLRYEGREEAKRMMPKQKVLIKKRRRR